MLEVSDLTHLNAALNGVTVVFLAAGLYFIRTGRRDRHQACMTGAVIASLAFLGSYLVYHFNAGLAKFSGQGMIRPVYFALLIAHVALAAVITPMVPIMLYRAVTGRFERHKAIARWTWPLWMTVAVSGVLVYVMAVHLFPSAQGHSIDV